MGNNLIKLAQRKYSNASGVNKNRTKQTQKNGKNSNAMLVAGSSNENHQFLSSSIFKLNRDCFDELFDYLSLRDLHSLAQTCESMHQMTGEFFTRNYSHSKFLCLSDGIYMLDDDGDINNASIDKCIPIPGFISFITWISIENTSNNDRIKKKSRELDKFRFIKLHSNEFESVKKLSLTKIHINKQIVGYISKILPNIEVLELTISTITQDFYDIFLKHCRSVRSIRLTEVYNKGKHFKWLRKHYEKLEHLELCMERKIDELDEFFERNPNLRSFSCDLDTFSVNLDALLNSKVKLDTLELNCEHFDEQYTDKQFLWDPLHQLHANGFFKRLHVSGLDDLRDDKLPAMPFFEQFSIGCNYRSLGSYANHLIEYVETGAHVSWLWNEIMKKSGKSKNEILVEDLINVERLYVFKETFDILLFIKKLRNLKKLKLVQFKSSEILQLDMLNTEREKLAGARKVTIYVPQTVYMATKWATKNGTTNFSLIEMKRSNSFEWNRFQGTYFTKLPPGLY